MEVLSITEMEQGWFNVLKEDGKVSDVATRNEESWNVFAVVEHFYLTIVFQDGETYHRVQCTQPQKDKITEALEESPPSSVFEMLHISQSQ